MKKIIILLALLISCKDTERVERADYKIFNDGFTACRAFSDGECLCCMVVNKPSGDETCDERSKFTMRCANAKQTGYRIINKIHVRKITSGE